MYSRYFPPQDACHPLPPEEEKPTPQPRQKQAAPHPPLRTQNSAPPPPRGQAGDLLGGITQELNKLLGGLFRFSLQDLDTGDILLILIVLFLFMEGDDLDLAIALGLTLLLSLGGPESDSTPPADAAPSHPEG